MVFNGSEPCHPVSIGGYATGLAVSELQQHKFVRTMSQARNASRKRLGTKTMLPASEARQPHEAHRKRHLLV
jgi:hypothetical protein